jgi:hypothetical protein
MSKTRQNGEHAGAQRSTVEEREATRDQPAFLDDHEVARWNARLAVLLSGRIRRMNEARAPVPGTVTYGAANYPHDPDVWLADWRENLPEGDPRRKQGPDIVRNGTPEAYATMVAAHQAIRAAYGLPSDVGTAEG